MGSFLVRRFFMDLQTGLYQFIIQDPLVQIRRLDPDFHRIAQPVGTKISSNL